MTRPPRDPAAPLLPRAAIVRSAAAGALLAGTAFLVYWWHAPVVSELQARALALIVLVAGYQVLLFAERLALPGSVRWLPRTPVFWAVWIAAALSLVAIVWVPSLADLFRVEVPTGSDTASAVLIGASSVAWRLIPGRYFTSGRLREHRKV
jgi:hypothetical protein